MAPCTGSCFCGDIKISFDAEPDQTARIPSGCGFWQSLTINQGICHCSQCRKVSGAAFSTNVVIEIDKLKVDGEVKVYTTTTTGSGMPADIHFCPRCGTTLFSKMVSMPGVTAIKTGVLDGDGLNYFKPTAEVHAATRASWLDPVKGTMVFDNMPPPAGEGNN